MSAPASSFGKAKSPESSILEAFQVIERAVNKKEPELHEAFQTVAKALDKAATEEILHGAFQTAAKALDKAAKEDKQHGPFENVAAAMLTIATFAAGITFNLLLKPSDPGPPARAFIFLSYANALFCAALMGCALVKISIELVRYSLDPTQNWNHPTETLEGEGGKAYLSVKFVEFIQRKRKWDFATLILSVETCIVGSIIYVAVYLLLYSSSLFLEVSGPFVLGSILYGIFGTLTIMVALVSVIIRNNLDAVLDIWLEKSKRGKKSEGEQSGGEQSGRFMNWLKFSRRFGWEMEIKANNPANASVRSAEKYSKILKANQSEERSADDSKKGNMEVKEMEEGRVSMKEPEQLVQEGT